MWIAIGFLLAFDLYLCFVIYRLKKETMKAVEFARQCAKMANERADMLDAFLEEKGLDNEPKE